MLTAGQSLAAVALIASGAVLVTRQAQRRSIARRPEDDAPLAARRALKGPPLVLRSVTISKPRQEIYDFWRDFSNLPRFMENVIAVREDEAGRMVWTIAAPAGRRIELVTELTKDRPGELLAWRTVQGSGIEADGKVRFRDAAGGRGTVVEALVRYRPPAGELGRWIAKLFQREPAIQGRRELRRLKMLMETGEIATNVNRKAA